MVRISCFYLGLYVYRTRSQLCNYAGSDRMQGRNSEKAALLRSNRW